MAQGPNTSERTLRPAVWLVGGTLAYNVVEGVIAVWSGTRAGSPALVSFGLDSALECIAAIAVLWHLAGSRRGERREELAHRVVGWSLLFLAIYVIVDGGTTLWRADAPEVSSVGIALGCASLLIMPGLALAKFRVARRLGSSVLRAEAVETLACTYLTVTLLLGLGLYAAVGWWWADPVAALLMVPWLVREGVEGLRGDCCGANKAEQDESRDELVPRTSHD